MSPAFDHPERVRRLQSVMAAADVDAVILSIGSDLPYFTGYEAMASERLTALVVPPEGRPWLIIPQLEAPRVEGGEFEVVPWGETVDPIALITDRSRPSRVAVGDQMWSTFMVALHKAWPEAQWIAASELTGGLRMRKSTAEVEMLRSAAQAVDRVLARVPDEIDFEGRTEADVARALERMTVEEGHDVPVFAIVASGPNGASPHHESGGRVIATGDLVVCDFGGSWGGYRSDVTRTFAVGEPGGHEAEVHQVVMRANAAARQIVRPGVECQMVDRAARAVIEDAGYGDHFIHRTGHGIGLDVHEHPYMVEGNQLDLEPGMTFSVEPGIYLPGEFGVRVEDIVACADDGPDTLNQASRGLVVVA